MGDFLKTNLFKRIVSKKEIPSKRFHLLKLFEYISQHKEYSFYKSNFKIFVPEAGEKRSVYSIRKHDKIVYTTNGHGFGGFMNHVTKEFFRQKDITNKLLKSIGVRSNNFVVCSSVEDVGNFCASQDFKRKFVVKPSAGSKGEGVFLNISNKDDLIKFSQRILDKWEEVQIEPMIDYAQDIRIQTIGGKFYAAVHRKKANVVSNGKLTVLELIEEKNKKKKFKPIKVDDTTRELLRGQGYSVESVPEKNKEIFLKEVCSFSQGGDVEDVTDRVNPKIISQVQDVCKYSQLDIIGLDILTDDISKPLEETGGVVLEVNPQSHWDVIYMVKGEKVIEDILNYLFKQ